MLFKFIGNFQDSMVILEISRGIDNCKFHDAASFDDTWFWCSAFKLITSTKLIKILRFDIANEVKIPLLRELILTLDYNIMNYRHLLF